MPHLKLHTTYTTSCSTRPTPHYLHHLLFYPHTTYTTSYTIHTTHTKLPRGDPENTDFLSPRWCCFLGICRKCQPCADEWNFLLPCSKQCRPRRCPTCWGSYAQCSSQCKTCGEVEDQRRSNPVQDCLTLEAEGVW